MSASDKRLLGRIARRYALITLACGAFSTIYEYFSHGVHSGFMVFLFLFPLLSAGIVLLAAARAPLPPSLAVRNLWGSGVATLTLGSCLRGIFDIYGTSVALVGVYWIAGTLLLLAAAGAYLRQCRSAA